MKATKKTDFDKFLTRLFSMQRDCFKQGSKTSLEVRPKWEDNDFVIYVCAYNENVNIQYEKGDGSKGVCHFEHCPIYSFWSVEENEAQMKKIQDFLTSKGDEQH